jgi:hypothetical protein
VCPRGKANKFVACHLCGQGVCPRCRSTKRVWISDKLGIMGSFRKIQACSKCVMRANTGTYEAPVERVRSQRLHQSSVSTSTSDGDPASKSVVENPTQQQKPACVLYEELTAARRPNRRRTKTPPTPEAPLMGRSFVHRGAAVFPDAVEIAVPCTSPEYEVPNRLGLRPPQSTSESRSYPSKTKLSAVDEPAYSHSVGSIPAEPSTTEQSSERGASSAASVMARLMELTNMAEATSYKTQVNGIFLAQQLQQQFKMQTTGGWRK